MMPCCVYCLFSQTPFRKGVGRITRIYLEFKLPEAIYCLSTILEENHFSYGKIGPIYGFIQNIIILYERTWGEQTINTCISYSSSTIFSVSSFKLKIVFGSSFLIFLSRNRYTRLISNFVIL
jgi:hypothetical protein